MAWSYPVATFIRDTVVAASRQFYELARIEANRKRFEWAVEQARPMVVTALSESLGVAKVALLKAFGVWGPLVNQVVETLVEATYQGLKAAADAKAVPIRAVNVTQEIIWPKQVVEVAGPVGSWDEGPIPAAASPPAPEAEQAEPGNESMIDDHAIGFHTLPHLLFPREQAEPGDTEGAA